MQFNSIETINLLTMMESAGAILTDMFESALDRKDARLALGTMQRMHGLGTVVASLNKCLPTDRTNLTITPDSTFHIPDEQAEVVLLAAGMHLDVLIAQHGTIPEAARQFFICEDLVTKLVSQARVNSPDLLALISKITARGQKTFRPERA